MIFTRHAKIKIVRTSACVVNIIVATIAESLIPKQQVNIQNLCKERIRDERIPKNTNSAKNARIPKVGQKTSNP